MSKLLNDLSSGKTPYQNYTIVHGIEQLEVLIPLTNVKAFESAFDQTDGNKKKILEAIAASNGKLKA